MIERKLAPSIFGLASCIIKAQHHPAVLKVLSFIVIAVINNLQHLSQFTYSRVTFCFTVATQDIIKSSRWQTLDRKIAKLLATYFSTQIQSNIKELPRAIA